MINMSEDYLINPFLIAGSYNRKYKEKKVPNYYDDLVSENTPTIDELEKEFYGE